MSDPTTERRRPRPGTTELGDGSVDPSRTMAAPTSSLRPAIQVMTFVRKESIAILRQPRLLLLLVVGPFLVLSMFAIGYDQQQVVMRTTFVGPTDSVYEESIEQYTDQLSAYLVFDSYGTDLGEARRRLRAGDVDLVVVFPDDAAESVTSGESAVIEIIHDKLDPIQQTAVEVAAQVAVQELNATVLEIAAGRAQQALTPYEQSLAAAGDALDALERAVVTGDDERAATAADQLAATASSMAEVVSASTELSAVLGADIPSEHQERMARVSATIDDIEREADRIAVDPDAADAQDVGALRERLDQVAEGAGDMATIDPAILARPFASDAQSLLRAPVTVNDYFAIGAVALLLQHMVLTFAALGLVSDRALGLFEVFRVGPIGPGRIVAGKYLAYLLLGAFVAAGLVGAVMFGLGVPQRGDLRWVLVAVAGVLSASIGLGMALSLLARSSTQAVQYAMLTLLSGLFFGGFFLDLDAFKYPVKAISWTLPVTYGVRLLRDVMLRGADPALVDLVGLATTSAVFGLAAWALLARALRVE